MERNVKNTMPEVVTALQSEKLIDFLKSMGIVDAEAFAKYIIHLKDNQKPASIAEVNSDFHLKLGEMHSDIMLCCLGFPPAHLVN